MMKSVLAPAVATIATLTCWVVLHAEVVPFASTVTPEDQLMLEECGWDVAVANTAGAPMPETGTTVRLISNAVAFEGTTVEPVEASWAQLIVLAAAPGGGLVNVSDPWTFPAPMFG